MDKIKRLIAKAPDYLKSAHAAVAWIGFGASILTAYHAVSARAATDGWAKAYVAGINVLMQECKPNE